MIKGFLSNTSKVNTGPISAVAGSNVSSCAPLATDSSETHATDVNHEKVKPVSLNTNESSGVHGAANELNMESGVWPAQFQSFQEFLDAKKNNDNVSPSNGNDPNGSNGVTNQSHGSDKVDTNSHDVVVIDKVGVDTMKQASKSYAGATSNEPKKHTSNFRRLECSKKSNCVDLSVPMKVDEEVNTRYENTLYGYFLGQRLAFSVVDYYVRNTWAKYGIQKVMMNAKGFFFFKFNSKKGVEDVLENGPWLIRNVPIILKPWNLNTNLLKEDLTNIPMWVKFHDVPLAMFSDDGLSLLATLIGTPKMLDAYTSHMCKESWGRSSFAMCMIDVKSDEVLRDSLTVEIPLLDGSGVTIEKIRVEYEWKPPRCDKCMIFGHTLTDCPKVVIPPVQPAKTVNDGFKTVNNKKKVKQVGSTIPGQGGFTKPVVGKQFQYQPKETLPEPKKVDDTKKKTSDVASSSGTKISTSNQFDALNMDDTDGFGIVTHMNE